MCIPKVIEESGLEGRALSRARATYILRLVALRHTTTGSVQDLSRQLSLSSAALQVFVYRQRMSQPVWDRLSPRMTDNERSDFLREVSVPNE